MSLLRLPSCFCHTRLRKRAVLGLLLLGLPTAGLARGGKASPDAADAGPPPTTGAPAVWVTAFADTLLLPVSYNDLGLQPPPGNPDAKLGPCPTIESQRGRCVDYVQFLSADGSLSGDLDRRPQATARSQKLRRNISSLYLGLWDGVVARWRKGSDPLASLLAEAGTSALPNAAELWAPSSELAGKLSALPDPKRWLLQDRWVYSGIGTPPEGVPYRRLTVYPAEVPQASNQGSAESVSLLNPGMVMLQGRTALRLLGTNNTSPDLVGFHEGEPQLFLSQYYPYDVFAPPRAPRDGVGCLDAPIPLACFQFPSAQNQDPDSPLHMPNHEDLRAKAEQQVQIQLRAFQDLLGMRLLQFGRREYDLSIVRSLGAWVLLSSPPTGSTGQQSQSATPNAANRYGTDEAQKVSPPPRMGKVGQYRLNYAAIPAKLVRTLLTDLELSPDSRCLAADSNMEPLPSSAKELEARAELFLEMLTAVEGLLDPKSPLRSDTVEWTPEASAGWLAAVSPLLTRSDKEIRDVLVAEGQPPQREALAEMLDRMVLERALDGRCLAQGRSSSTPAGIFEEERLRARALLAHIRFDLVAGLPGPGADAIPPAQVEALAKASWEGVLAQHGSQPTALPPGQGQVNPTAVCAIGSGPEAVEEPVVDRIKLELLIAVPASTAPDDVVWEARQALPFLWVDDLRATQPEVTRLAALGDSLALVRVRWELWSGWHLLWGLRADSTGVGSTLTLHTAAFCEDTVLTTPTLVPTLVRAGLLSDPLRSTTPVSRKDAQAQRAAATRREPVSNDEALAKAQSAGEAATRADSVATVTASQVARDPQAGITASLTGMSQLEALADPSDPSDPSDPAPGMPGDSAAYLRGLVLPPLQGQAGARAALVMVMDSTLDSSRIMLRQPVPSTPYQHRRARVGPGEWLRTAAWVLALTPEIDDPQGPLTPALPTRVPNATVQSPNARPGWRRDPVSEVTVVADVAGFPWRQVSLRCVPDHLPDLYSGTASCDRIGSSGDEGPTLEVYNSFGPTVSLGALATTWLGNDPRIALEYGLETQLDLVVRQDAGAGDDPFAQPELTWAYALRAGGVVGLRFTPDPLWLHRRVGRREQPPRLWGADGDLDGRSALGRTQAGVRGGVAVEPFTPGGLPLVFSTEGWVGWSATRRLSPWAPYTPFQPNTIMGPFVRVHLAVPVMQEDLTTSLVLDHRLQVTVGLRIQPRLDLTRFQVPELQ